MMNRYSFMSDSVQIFFIMLSDKFCNEDRALRKDEKVVSFIDLERKP